MAARDPMREQQLIDEILEEEDLAEQERREHYELLVSQAKTIVDDLKIKQQTTPEVLSIVRDLLLEGADVDAIAILANELDLVPRRMKVLNENYGNRPDGYGVTWFRTRRWRRTEGAPVSHGWFLKCEACYGHENNSFISDEHWHQDGTRYDVNPRIRPVDELIAWMLQHTETCPHNKFAVPDEA